MAFSTSFGFENFFKPQLDSAGPEIRRIYKSWSEAHQINFKNAIKACGKSPKSLDAIFLISDLQYCEAQKKLVLAGLDRENSGSVCGDYKIEIRKYFAEIPQRELKCIHDYQRIFMNHFSQFDQQVEVLKKEGTDEKK